MNKLKKSIEKLETHEYAPELNKLILKSGAIIKTPGATQFYIAMRKFKPATHFAKRVVIQVTHSLDDHKFCDKEYGGIRLDYQHLKNDLIKLKNYHNLPDANIKIISIYSNFA